MNTNMTMIRDVILSLDINTSLVTDSFHNQQNEIGDNALNTLTIIGFGLVFLGLIVLLYLATGRITDKDEQKNG